jgi:hypothetical protein
MGFRVLLIQVTGKNAATVQAEFGVEPTEEFEEISESPVTGVCLADGSYLLYINDPDLIVANPATFAQLSKSAALLACYVNETCMESLATGWTNGREEWSVHHDAQRGIRHLELTGTVPAPLSQIRDDFVARQTLGDDVDSVFEVPVELVNRIGGFRYDSEVPGAEGRPFQVLVRV